MTGIYIPSTINNNHLLQDFKQMSNKNKKQNVNQDGTKVALPKVQSQPKFQIFKLEPVKLSTEQIQMGDQTQNRQKRKTLTQFEEVLQINNSANNKLFSTQASTQQNNEGNISNRNGQTNYQNKIIIFDTEQDDINLKSQIDTIQLNGISLTPMGDQSLHLPNISKIKMNEDQSMQNSKQTIQKNKLNFTFNSRSVANLFKLSKQQAILAQQVKTRKRTFEINLERMIKNENKFSGHVYNMGIIKYDPRVYKDQKSQFMILQDQMSVLSDKIGQFIFHLNSRGDQKIRQLFEYVTPEQQLIFNKRLEIMIGMIIIIGKSVLQEFGDTPQKIGIKNTDYLLKKQDMITNEIDALIENFETLREIHEIFKNCQSAYKIIQTNYDREAEDPQRIKVVIDLLDKTRFFCGELLEKFKIAERNYAATVIQVVVYIFQKQRKKDTDKARDDLFRSFLPEIDNKLAMRRRNRRKRQSADQSIQNQSIIDENNDDYDDERDDQDYEQDNSNKMIGDFKFSFQDMDLKSQFISPSSKALNNTNTTTNKNALSLLKANNNSLNPSKIILEQNEGKKKKKSSISQAQTIKKETYEMIDKMLKRNMSKASLQKIMLSKKDTKLTTKDVMPDEVEILNEQGKEKNMDMMRCVQIQKALKVGAGLCSSQIAENIYPLQRELGEHRDSLSKSISEIIKLKNVKMRIY
ncbi:UNKNOWN [Stylonychia lemnae]|uniref:Uncharacterized protein n=1 Tax=Stylonychia lemnae TaxID=5949 RepID=A0A078B5X8_STYLE|nr:UNKNOWN [Stylonychia lemnae]|eukprot:CDW88893.1 UNKNOWN [Stylonychia lemnae]